MTTEKDAIAIGTLVAHLVDQLIEAPPQLQLQFSATALDVMGPSGLRRAYLIVTTNEELMRKFETNAAEASRQRKEARG